MAAEVKDRISIIKLYIKIYHINIIIAIIAYELRH